MPILSGLIEISVYSCGELRKAGLERNIDMKKLVIILAIAIMLFAILKQRTGQSSVATQGTPLNTAAVQAEKVPETHTAQVEQITEATSEPIPTENKAATKAEPAVQKTPVKECTEEAEDSNVAESEETVKCVDQGDQNLADNRIPSKLRNLQRSLTIQLKISYVKAKIVPEKESISDNNTPSHP